MTTFNTGVFRDSLTDPSQDPRELPIEVARDVIQVAVQNSAVMQLARVQPMPTRQATVPVLTQYPDAYWLTGTNQSDKDVAQKQTTSVDWDKYTLRAEEMAVLVPIPDAYIQDTGVDLFNEIKPLLGQAFGRKLDAAVLFGQDSPWGISTGIYAQTVASGNVVTVGATTDPQTGHAQDLASDIADLGVALESDGFELNGLAVGPGFKWKLVKLRSTTGEPIYAPPADGQPATIYGETMATIKNGTWDATRVSMIAGDWDYVRIGVRSDISFNVFDQGVITDGAGNVVYNAVQQDGKILRATMRVAYVLAAPKVTPLNSVDPFPFAALRPSGAPAS